MSLLCLKIVTIKGNSRERERERQRESLTLTSLDAKFNFGISLIFTVQHDFAIFKFCRFEAKTNKVLLGTKKGLVIYVYACNFRLPLLNILAYTTKTTQLFFHVFWLAKPGFIVK